MMFALFLLTSLATDAGTALSVRDGCSEDAVILANVQTSDQIAIHHGVAGETLPCYAVSVVLSGAEVRGYVLGTSLPAVQEFERRRALESRISIPAPPPPAEKEASDKTISPEDAGPFAGRQFPDWSGVDWNGKHVTMHPGDAKITLVAFVNPRSKAARLQIVGISFIMSKFGNKALKSVGLIEGASLFDTKTYMEDLEVNFPLASDRSSLAKDFGAEPSKGTILVLDSSSKVVASSTDSKKIQSILTKLLAP
jgi:hypothetical protein